MDIVHTSFTKNGYVKARTMRNRLYVLTSHTVELYKTVCSMSRKNFGNFKIVFSPIQYRICLSHIEEYITVFLSRICGKKAAGKRSLPPDDHFIPNQFPLIRATVSRQIASSSFVGTTQTLTFESGVEITMLSPRFEFASSSRVMPRYPR